jgi:hypothetical protein
MTPATAGSYSPADPAAPSEPWPFRRALPLLATLVLILIGMAGTIWGPVYYHETAWAVPDDLWATLVAAQRLTHLAPAGMCTPPPNRLRFPRPAVILVPVAAVMVSGRDPDPE